MRKMVVLQSKEAKELEERLSLIHPFEEDKCNFKFGNQSAYSQRVKDLLIYKISKRND